MDVFGVVSRSQVSEAIVTSIFKGWRVLQAEHLPAFVFFEAVQPSDVLFVVCRCLATINPAKRQKVSFLGGNSSDAKGVLIRS